MDITLMGRNVGITDRFRAYAEEKADKVEALADKALALEIRLCRHHETNGTAGDDRVEMTLIGPGPVVRAEAGGSDKYAAFDAALAKLLERVRRAKDRKKVHRGHGNRLTSLREASTAGFSSVDVVPADAERLARLGSRETTPVADEPRSAADEATPYDPPGYHEQGDYTPVVIRTKVFPGAPMTVDDALYRMELVGHDFYLFTDSASGRPSVVYRRKGWSYGVIGLDPDAGSADVDADQLVDAAAGVAE